MIEHTVAQIAASRFDIINSHQPPLLSTAHVRACAGSRSVAGHSSRVMVLGQVRFTGLRFTGRFTGSCPFRQRFSR